MRAEITGAAVPAAGLVMEARAGQSAAADTATSDPFDAQFASALTAVTGDAEEPFAARGPRLPGGTHTEAPPPSPTGKSTAADDQQAPVVLGGWFAIPVPFPEVPTFDAARKGASGDTSASDDVAAAEAIDALEFTPPAGAVAAPVPLQPQALPVETPQLEPDRAVAPDATRAGSPSETADVPARAAGSPGSGRAQADLPSAAPTEPQASVLPEDQILVPATGREQQAAAQRGTAAEPRMNGDGDVAAGAAASPAATAGPPALRDSARFVEGPHSKPIGRHGAVAPARPAAAPDAVVAYSAQVQASVPVAAVVAAAAMQPAGDAGEPTRADVAPGDTQRTATPVISASVPDAPADQNFSDGRPGAEGSPEQAGPVPAVPMSPRSLEPHVGEFADVAGGHDAQPPAAAAQHGNPATVPVVGGPTWSSPVSANAWTVAPPLDTTSVHLPDADTPERLVQSLRMQFLRGGGDAVLQLRPEHLGSVTVALRVEQGGVSARIVAADPVVVEWLQTNEHTLRDGLQANGLSLDRLVIDRDGSAPDRRERDRRQGPPRPRFRAPADRQSTFELTI